MWGLMIVGYGWYDYIYDSGYFGSLLVIGFVLCKVNQVVYILFGYIDFGDILDCFGKWKKGKLCFYINKFVDIDEVVLVELICVGLDDLVMCWFVYFSQGDMDNCGLM